MTSADDESAQEYECAQDRCHSTAINPDFGTVQLYKRNHLLVRKGLDPRSGPTNPCSGIAPAAPPPESTLPPILLPSAVVPSVARSGSDLLPGCVATERVVGVEFDGPAGACPQIGKRRHHINLCVFFIVRVRARERLSCPCAWNGHLRRLLRRVVGLRGVILELSVDPIRNGDRVTGEPSRGNKPPNVFLKSS